MYRKERQGISLRLGNELRKAKQVDLLVAMKDQLRFFQHLPESNCSVTHSTSDWSLSAQAVNGGDTVLMTKPEHKQQQNIHTNEVTTCDDHYQVICKGTIDAHTMAQCICTCTCTYNVSTYAISSRFHILTVLSNEQLNSSWVPRWKATPYTHTQSCI